MKKKKVLSLLIAATILSGSLSTIATQPVTTTATEATEENNATETESTEASDQSQDTGTETTEAAEYQKDENVYGILDNEGNLDELYIVNQFKVTKAGEISDFGAYKTVTNLTNTDKISESDNKQTVNVKEGNFYYQGEKEDGQLPWNFKISYYINGIETKPSALAGANGDVRIHIESSKNENVNPAFYDSYMMQISTTLDNDKVTDIIADGATIADAGTSKQVNFTVMPGKDANIDLILKVHDFAMSGLSIAGVPFSMSMDMADIDTDAMTGDMSQLTDGISQLSDGATQLSTGTQALSDGIASLSTGLTELSTGATTLSDNGSSIKEGSTGINEALSGLNTQVQNMDLSGLSPEDAAILTQTISALSTNYSTFDSGLSSYLDGVSGVAGGISQTAEGTASLATGASDLADGASQLATGAQQMNTGVSDMPEQIDEKVDEMMDEFNKEFVPVSFVDEQNTNIQAVQFTLTTPAIERPEKTVVEEEAPEKNIFDRLADLFR